MNKVVKIVAIVSIFLVVQYAQEAHAFGLQQPKLEITNNSGSKILVGIYKQEYRHGVNYIKEPSLYQVEEWQMSNREVIKKSAPVSMPDVQYFIFYRNAGGAQLPQVLERKDAGSSITNITGKSSVVIG